MSETQGPEEKERLLRKTKITKIYVNVHMGMGTWEKSHSICISLLVNFNEALQFIDRVVLSMTCPSLRVHIVGCFRA